MTLDGLARRFCRSGKRIKKRKNHKKKKNIQFNRYVFLFLILQIYKIYYLGGVIGGLDIPVRIYIPYLLMFNQINCYD